jgi:hypothetical protein
LSLIGVTPDEQRGGIANAREKAEFEFAGRSEGVVLAAVAASRSQSFREQQAIREAAVARLAAPEVLERTEHSLGSFADLLEQNPRGMKRLVNSFSANQAIALLSYVDIEREQLARWTILSLRWPMLTEYLEAHPSMVDPREAKAAGDAEESEEIRRLIADEEVRNVMGAEGVRGRLDTNAVQQCTRLRGY